MTQDIKLGADLELDKRAITARVARVKTREELDDLLEALLRASIQAQHPEQEIL